MSKPLRMALVAGRMLQHELAQHQLERELAPAVAARVRLRDVVANDGLDAHLAARRAHQVVAELGGGDLRQPLVMRDREHLALAQLAQGDAVLQAKHGRRPAARAPWRIPPATPARRSRWPDR